MSIPNTNPELFIIRNLPPFPGCQAYVSLFVSPIHERKGRSVLVDVPVTWDTTERRWIPASHVVK